MRCIAEIAMNRRKPLAAIPAALFMKRTHHMDAVANVIEITDAPKSLQ